VFPKFITTSLKDSNEDTINTFINFHTSLLYIKRTIRDNAISYHSIIGCCDCIFSMTKRKSNFKYRYFISFIEFHNQINVYYIKDENRNIQSGQN
jgi:hypothetical protein